MPQTLSSLQKTPIILTESQVNEALAAKKMLEKRGIGPQQIVVGPGDGHNNILQRDQIFDA